MIHKINNIFKDAINFIKKYRIIFYVIFIYTIGMLVVFKFILKKYFTISNDAIYQYSLFYSEWIKKIISFIKTGHFDEYSFNMFLGTDFYSSMGYYCTGDIFLPLLLLFRNNLRIGLLVESFLCVLISGISMCLLLEKIDIKNKSTIVFISLVYALAGYSIWFNQIYMFHRFYAFLPLLFYSLEVYFVSKSKKRFIIVTALLFMQNYYLMYPTLIFLFLYCLTRAIKNRTNLKKCRSIFFDLFFSIIVGFLISSFITLPSILSTISIVKRRNLLNNYKRWYTNTKLGIFLSYLSINPIYAFPSMFSSTFDYNEESFNIFVTIIPLIFCIYELLKKENKKDLYLFMLLQIICFAKPLNSIMHGFSLPSLRWLFLLEFYVLILAAKGIEGYDEKEKKKIIRIGLSIMIIAVIFAILLLIKYYDPLLHHYHLIFIIFSLVMEFLIYVFVTNNKYLSYFLTVIFIFCSSCFVYSFVASDNEMNLKTIDKDELVNLLSDNNNPYRFYYSYKDSFDGQVLNLNSSLINDIPTTSSYNTMYETVIDDFIDVSKGRKELDWIIEIDDPDCLRLLGVKYYISKNANLIDSNIELIGELNNMSPPNMYVYLNNRYDGFIHSIDENNCLESISYESNIDAHDSSLYFKCYVDKQEKVVIPIPNNLGWRIIVNDEKVKPIDVLGGFIGLTLPKGENTINMSFTSPYLQLSMVLSLIGISIYVFLIFRERIKNI